MSDFLQVIGSTVLVICALFVITSSVQLWITDYEVEKIKGALTRVLEILDKATVNKEEDGNR